MLPTLESLTVADEPDSRPRTPAPAAIVITLALMAGLAAAYFLSFDIENRHPIDKIDVLRETVHFVGLVTIIILSRRDIRILNLGFAVLMVSLWMEVIDEFTMEPHWAGTIVPALLGLTGIAMLALGVAESSRRRGIERQRRSVAEDGLRKSLSVLRAVVEATPDAVWVKGPDGRYVLANTAFAELVGKPEDAIVGRGEAELFANEPDTRGRAVARALESGAAERFEATIAEGGEPRTFLVSRKAFKDESGRAIGVLGVARDITDRKELEDRLFQQAHHDALTGLANRAAFMERLGRALQRWRYENDRQFAILFIDIDRFKDVNDRFGHAVGDELLANFAEALGHWLRPGDFIARMGGDEFTVLLGDVAGQDGALAIADRIVEGLRQPFSLGSGSVSVTASIGVAMCTAGPEGPEVLLKVADAAMYRAKQMGKARHVMAAV